nr:transcriptional regulator [Auraticoccus cholistanensis]
MDEVVHAPVRFSIMAYLAGVERAEFALVRDAVEVSDSQLSKQAATLETAGYLQITKGHVGKRPRTWFALTPAGREAFETHLTTLRRIAGGR